MNSSTCRRKLFAQSFFVGPNARSLSFLIKITVMTNVSFQDIKLYLNAVADKAANDIGNSPHDRFWNIAYADFINGVVPHVKCNGNPIPLIDKTDPVKSAFYTIMVDAMGFCQKRQMPGGGPFVTDNNYQLTLPDGSTVTGQQILDNIKSWLLNGFPESIKPS